MQNRIGKSRVEWSGVEWSGVESITKEIKIRARKFQHFCFDFFQIANLSILPMVVAAMSENRAAPTSDIAQHDVIMTKFHNVAHP